MVQWPGESNYLTNIFVVSLAIFNIFVLFTYPDPVTGIIVLSYTGAIVLTLQFRELLK
jgi:Co/Zn/Cd efflux system component